MLGLVLSLGPRLGPGCHKAVDAHLQYLDFVYKNFFTINKYIFLRFYCVLPVPNLLSFTENTVLYKGLFSQMEEHERALDLLTHKLKDYRGAEDYCATYSQVRLVPRPSYNLGPLTTHSLVSISVYCIHLSI